MPLILEGLGPVPAARAPGRHDRPSGAGRGRLDIGLVNNMPDAALKPTERQFARLLAAASGALDVRLHLFSLPEVPRGDAARGHMRGRYGDLAALERARLDALIVTGAEPVAPSLADEPYWDALTRVVDWAEHNTVSTVWSCLAAHAAVLHLDGIARRRLPEKRSGLFECVRVAEAGLLDGAPAGMRVPHSRWNDLPEGELRRHGYRIESRSLEAGIDTFTKQWGSLFVFLQGHPEYDVETLFREYRRDVQRFLGGERDGLPGVPAHYFDARTEGAAADFARRAAELREPGAWGLFPRVWAPRADLVERWQATAARLYGNWLGHVAEIR
jgi:homoserine O-succinyltransferase